MSVTHLLLAPGASGGIERLAPYRGGLLDRGIAVTPVALPRGAAERAVPAYRTAMERSEGPTAAGGHSFGGRVASLLAAERPPAALVLLSYPLHAPGRHDAWEARTAHWPRIACPVLVLSGEADPFARHDLLREAVGRLRNATVRTWPRVGHGLVPVLPEALDEIAVFLHGIDS
jgi:pimeloyl-ACP methyl ester carboxylesterase